MAPDYIEPPTARGRNGVEIGDRMSRPKDVICDHPKILFVGINPGVTSGKVGHHFAGPYNPFYELLHAARLVPEVLKATDDHRLAEFGYGLVNLCTRPTQLA